MLITLYFKFKSLKELTLWWCHPRYRRHGGQSDMVPALKGLVV